MPPPLPKLPTWASLATAAEGAGAKLRTGAKALSHRVEGAVAAATATQPGTLGAMIASGSSGGGTTTSAAAAAASAAAAGFLGSVGGLMRRGAATPAVDTAAAAAAAAVDASAVALLAHELSGMGKGAELKLFDPKWARGALSVWPVTKHKSFPLEEGCSVAPVVAQPPLPTPEAATSGSSSSSEATASVVAPILPAGDVTVVVAGADPPSTATPPAPAPRPTLAVPRYLALSRDRLLVLAPHASRLGVGCVKSNHHLSEFVKASYSRKVPGRVTLHMRRCAPPGDEGATGDAASAATYLVTRTYFLDGASEAADAFIKSLGDAVTALG